MILETRELTKRYGEHVVLQDVNLKIAADSIYGLVGPNGAGKTTLLSIIAGLRRPTSGEVKLKVKKHNIAICPDVPEFEPWLTALEVMQLAANLVGKASTTERLEKLLEDAGLTASIDRRVGDFSRGMTQRLALATTIVGDPAFIILDEPCSALDPNGRVEVLDTISRISAHSTILFSTHILADVQRVCNQVGVLNNGKMLYQGDLGTFLHENTQPVWNITLQSGVNNVKEALTKAAWVTNVQELTKNKLQITGTSIDEIEQQLVQVLAGVNARVVSIEPLDSDLEHAFLNLTHPTSKESL